MVRSGSASGSPPGWIAPLPKTSTVGGRREGAVQGSVHRFCVDSHCAKVLMLRFLLARAHKAGFYVWGVGAKCPGCQVHGGARSDVRNVMQNLRRFVCRDVSRSEVQGQPVRSAGSARSGVQGQPVSPGSAPAFCHKSKKSVCQVSGWALKFFESGSGAGSESWCGSGI